MIAFDYVKAVEIVVVVVIATNKIASQKYKIYELNKIEFSILPVVVVAAVVADLDYDGPTSRMCHSIDLFSLVKVSSFHLIN